MGNIKNKFKNFMSGRYGADQLYNVSIVICFILIVVNMFVRSSIIGTLLWVVLILTVFRSFSRNIYKRQRENEKFMKIWKPFKTKGSLTMRRFKEIKTHRFRKCKYCKKVLRLPRKPGKHTVTCPSCHKEFEVRILL